jgi:hypothetical protein
MITRNSMLTGFFAALIFPAIALLITQLLKTNYFIINKPAAPLFVAVALNLILISICIKRDLDKTSRGIMLGTIAATVILFIVLKIHLHL